MSKSKAPALAKGLDIIDLIKTKGSQSFNEIQDYTKDNPASLSRYLHTLIEKNYLLKNQSQKYELGLKLIDLKDNKSIWPRLKSKCLPHLKYINQSYGVTVLLLAYNQDNFVAIDKVIALNNLGMMEKDSVCPNDIYTIWTNLFYTNLNDCSIGEFIQSKRNPIREASQYFDPEYLMNQVAENGYVSNLSNNNEIFRIGIPIRYQNQVIATIGIGTFINQVTKETIDLIIKDTLEFSKALSKEI